VRTPLGDLNRLLPERHHVEGLIVQLDQAARPRLGGRLPALMVPDEAEPVRRLLV
jgi:hypothetical protein